MKLIVGLGNPGKNYVNTRHNVGFDFIDKLAKTHEINFSMSFEASYGFDYITSHKIILAKPQTYMNLSGESVQKILLYYKINLCDIIIVHDDIDIEIGNIKVAHRGSGAGHNGIKNIINNLNSQEFARIRVGIGKRPIDLSLDQFVLGKFSDDERKKINFALDISVEAVKLFVESDIFTVMNKFNSKKKNN
jgi:PTH1 family peptidyl-tRNA hydrolase